MSQYSTAVGWRRRRTFRRPSVRSVATCMGSLSQAPPPPPVQSTLGSRETLKLTSSSTVNFGLHVKQRPSFPHRDRPTFREEEQESQWRLQPAWPEWQKVGEPGAWHSASRVCFTEAHLLSSLAALSSITHCLV